MFRRFFKAIFLNQIVTFFTLAKLCCPAGLKDNKPTRMINEIAIKNHQFCNQHIDAELQWPPPWAGKNLYHGRDCT